MMTKKLIYLMCMFVIVDGFGLMFEGLGRVDVWLWLILYVPLILFSFLCWSKFLLWSLKKNLWLMIVVLSFMGLSLYGVFLPRSYSFETANEIGCVLEEYVNSDFGWHKTCLYGYPIRQFFLPGLIPLFFGRTQVNLNLGPWFYFFLGSGVFFEGIRKYFSKKHLLVLTGVGLGLFLNLYHLHMWLSFYEQSLYPFAFSMYIVGLALLYLKDKSDQLLVLGSFCLLHLSHTYTSSLALVALGIGFLVYEVQINTNKKKQKLIIVLGTMVITSLAISFSYREDLKFGVLETEAQSWQATLIEGLSAIILNNQPVKAVATMAQPVVLILIGLMLLGKMGGKIVWVGWWMIGVLGVSIMASGYAQDLVHFRLHKVLVIYPVLGVIMMKWIQDKKWLVSKQKYWIYLLLMGWLISGFHMHWKFRKSLKLENDLKVCHFLGKVGVSQDQQFGVWVSPVFAQELTTLDDALSYFYPKARTGVMPQGCAEYGELDENIFLIPSKLDHNCSDIISEGEKIGSLELYYKKRVNVYRSVNLK